MLHFSWDVIEMTKTRLKIQIAFQNPIHVSAGEEPERLELSIYDANLFISKDGYLLRDQKRNQKSRRILSEKKDEPFLRVVT